MSTCGDGRQRETMEPSPDAQLMLDLCAASEDALEVLFRRYGRLIRRVAIDILRDEGEAEDVTQEVFLEVYRKAHLYDPTRGSVRAWLLQYAHHRSLRRRDALRLRAAYRGEPLEDVDGRLREHRRHLTRQECGWIIRAGLSQLPERQRAALELVCLEELSLRDVADHLHVSLGCARHYYYRGLARLRAWAVLAGISPRERCEPRPRGRTRHDAPGASSMDGLIA